MTDELEKLYRLALGDKPRAAPTDTARESRRLELQRKAQEMIAERDREYGPVDRELQARVRWRKW